MVFHSHLSIALHPIRRWSRTTPHIFFLKKSVHLSFDFQMIEFDTPKWEPDNSSHDDSSHALLSRDSSYSVIVTAELGLGSGRSGLLLVFGLVLGLWLWLGSGRVKKSRMVKFLEGKNHTLLKEFPSKLLNRLVNNLGSSIVRKWQASTDIS